MPNPFDYLSEYFSKLPPKLKEIFFSPEWGERIEQIGVENRLHVDQIGILFDEVGLVLLGKIQMIEFKDHLSAALGLDSTTTESLSKDLNEGVFLKIREELEQRTTEEEESDDVSKEDLLREIESPTPTKARVMPSTTGPSLIERHNAKVLGADASAETTAPAIPDLSELSLPSPIDTSHELAAPHSSEIAAAIPAAQPTQVVPPQAPIPKPVVATPAVPPANEITRSTRTITEIHPELKPQSRKGSVDPYREPVE